MSDVYEVMMTLTGNNSNEDDEPGDGDVTNGINLPSSRHSLHIFNGHVAISHGALAWRAHVISWYQAASQKENDDDSVEK